MKQPALNTVCAWCNRVRTPAGEWRQVERPGLHLSPATHGICPDCLEQATTHATMAPVTR